MRISPYLFFGSQASTNASARLFLHSHWRGVFACNAHYTVYAAWIEKTLEGPHLMKEGKSASGICDLSDRNLPKFGQLWLAKCYSDLLPAAFMIHQDKGPWPFFRAGYSIALREACRGYAPKEKKSICPRLPYWTLRYNYGRQMLLDLLVNT